jgi:hypothetical protein
MIHDNFEQSNIIILSINTMYIQKGWTKDYNIII